MTNPSTPFRWPSKDPDEVLDYSWQPALDDGDTIVSHVVDQISGTAVIDSDSLASDRVVVWISGGTEGETNEFALSVVTAAGRTFEVTAFLLVSSSAESGSLVALAQAKKDLRVEGEDDDVDVALKLQMATDIVIDYIKQPEHGWTEDDAPFLIKAAIILVLRNLYDVENADPLTDGVKAILHRFRDPALA